MTHSSAHLDPSQSVAVVEVSSLGIQHDASPPMEEVGATAGHIRVLGVLTQPHKGCPFLFQEVSQPYKVKIGAHKDKLPCTTTQV